MSSGKLRMDMNRKPLEDSTNRSTRVPAIGQIYRACGYPSVGMGAGPGAIHPIYGNSGLLARLHSLLRFDLLERCIHRGLPDSFFPAGIRRKANSPNRFVSQSISISRLFTRFSWFHGLIENRIENHRASYFLLGMGYEKSILNQCLPNPRLRMLPSSRKLTNPVAERGTFLPAVQDMAEGMEKVMWPAPDARHQIMSTQPLQEYAFRMSESITRKWPSKKRRITKKDIMERSVSGTWKGGGPRTERNRLPWEISRETAIATKPSQWSIASKWPSVSMTKRHKREIGFNVLTSVKNTNALTMKTDLKPEVSVSRRDEASFIRSKAQRAMEEILHEIVPTREREEAVEVKGEIERMEGLMTGLVNQQRQQLEEVRQLRSSVQTALQELDRPKSLESSVGAMRPLSLRGRL